MSRFSGRLLRLMLRVMLRLIPAKNGQQGRLIVQDAHEWNRMHRSEELPKWMQQPELFYPAIALAAE